MDTKKNLSDSKKPIGVFDSGLGGLTVVKEIIKLLPNEDIIYLGDTARVPYGGRSNEIITKFSEEDVKFLISKKVKCIVIACHTSSAVSGKYLDKKYLNVPIFDVVSPIIETFKKSKEKSGVIGTRATINSKVYSKLNGIVQIPCPLFVPLIEEGEVEGNLIESVVKKYLKDVKVSSLILGCTHYPIIESVIKKVLPETKLINPGILVSEKIKHYFDSKNLNNSNKKKGKLDIFVTDLTGNFTKVTKMFLGKNINARISKVRF